MGLLRNLRHDTVGRLPLREAVLLKPTAKVRAAIDRMQAKQLGCAVVVDSEGAPLGVFSEHCVVQLLLSDPAAIDRDPVKKHLDIRWAIVRQSDNVATVAQKMHELDIRFVVVTNEQGLVTAVSGQKGFMEFVAEHFPRVMVQRTGGVALKTRA